MPTITIERKKSLLGCLATYQIVLGYDVEKFKKLIQEIAEYYQEKTTDLKKEEYFHQEIENINYLTIKNKEILEIEVTPEVKTIFICNNAIFNNQFYPTLFSLYPLVCSNQVEINGNINLEIITKNSMKKPEFVLRENKNK